MSVNGRSDMQKICEDTRELAKHATFRQPLGLVGYNHITHPACMRPVSLLQTSSNKKLVLYQMTCDNAILTCEHDICMNHSYRKKPDEVHIAYNIQYQIYIIIGLNCLPFITMQ